MGEKSKSTLFLMRVSRMAADEEVQVGSWDTNLNCHQHTAVEMFPHLFSKKQQLGLHIR